MSNWVWVDVKRPIPGILGPDGGGTYVLVRVANELPMECDGFGSSLFSIRGQGINVAVSTPVCQMS